MKPSFSLFFFVTLMAILAPMALAEPVYLTPEDWADGTPFRSNHPALDEPIELRQKVIGYQVQSMAREEPDIVAHFESAMPWASGGNSTGETFDGSIFKGVYFFGSSVLNDDYVSVEIRFSSTDSTWCGTFRRDLGYVAGGPGLFPGTVWDVSDPDNHRRLNLCFVEDLNRGPVNSIWDPDTSNSGKREYLYIMLSDYDGDGSTYAGANGSSGAVSLDILYNWWPRVADGHTLLESLPATLYIDVYHVKRFRGIPNRADISLAWEYLKTDPTSFDIYGGSSPNPTTFLQSASGSDRTFKHSGLTPGATFYYKIEAVTGGQVVDQGPTVQVSTHPDSAYTNVVGFWHGRERYGDCWGYTDPATQKEYALICARNEGVSIIDIDADPPVEVGFIPSLSPNKDAKDVKIYDHYAIVVKQSEDIQIVDISDVTTPVQVSTWDPGFGNGAHNCMVEGDYLYVVGFGTVTDGLKIVDISNPAAPIEVSHFESFYYHDIDIRNDTLCGTGIWGDGIELIDIADKANPQFISLFNYAGSGAHNAEFSFDGHYVFIGDEIGSSGNHIRTFDITDPFNISMVSEMIVDTTAVVHNCYLYQDTLLVIAHYVAGVRFWNVADPVNPFEIAFYDTYPRPGLFYKGCWSVYTGFASGRIIASDMSTGLYVIDLDLEEAPPCCVGYRGDVNGDGADKDIVDLTCIVDFLFGSGCLMPCTGEADINGDGAVADIVDLTFIVDFLFGIAPPEVTCP